MSKNSTEERVSAVAQGFLDLSFIGAGAYFLMQHFDSWRVGVAVFLICYAMKPVVKA